MIFAVAIETNVVKLYDLRSYDKGPFSSFVVNYTPVEWTGMKFSSDGKYILLTTSSNMIFLLDAFTGDNRRQFVTRNSTGRSLEASFSPDAQFVLAGAEDGTIKIWETATGAEVTTWSGHVGPVSVVQWNPKTMMVASGCNTLAFWTYPEDA